MKIPRTFHATWIGDKPIPSEYLYYMSTWKTHHPSWDYKLWTDRNMPVDDFINHDLYLSEDGPVFKSDIARIELLNLYGGVYVDCDFEAYKNIEPLIKDVDHFFTGEQKGIIGNAIFGSVPGHHILKKMLEGMPDNAESNSEYGPNIKVGVVYLTKTIPIDMVNYLEPSLFYPTPPGTSYPPGRVVDFPRAYAHHHWGASWIGVEEKKGYEVWKLEQREDYEWLKNRMRK